MAKVMCHWTADRASRMKKYDYRLSREERVAYAKQSRVEYKALRDAGFKPMYFQFENKNDKQSAEAKVKAEKHAAEWQSKTGIIMTVYEGAFL